MLTRDQLIEIESTRLWRRGYRLRRLTSKLMKKYGLDRDKARKFARRVRKINLGKIIPDWSKSPRLGSENVKSITPKKPTQK